MLLKMHKLLIAFALGLAAILIWWGAVHWIARREPGAWVVFFVGVTAAIAGSLYYRKLRRNPPIR